MKIIIDSLTKKYKKTYALKDLNSEISEHIYGLMGPNGSGKTTLIRCILDLINYKEGKIEFISNGKKVPYSQINFGYLPQVFELFKDLTVYEQLEYFFTLKQINDLDCKEEINRVLELVNMISCSQKKCRHLSGGMVRRIGIAQALLGNPDILIFDEPTVGLDPDERLNMKRIIKSISKDIPIILSTHIIEDVSSTCTHGIFIKEGQIICSGELKKLIKQLDDCVYTCSIEESYKIEEDVLIRNIDDISVRIITKENIDYPFLKKVEANINDLYQYVNHKK